MAIITFERILAKQNGSLNNGPDRSIVKLVKLLKYIKKLSVIPQSK